MRLSELMKLHAVDSEGELLDHVRDVRLEDRDDGWVVTHVVVGRAAVAQRLGFIHGAVERPALLAWAMRRSTRHARVVPWEKVTLGDGDAVHVGARRAELDRPEGYR